MRHVSESLAGRAVYFVLYPMTIGEMLNRPAPTLLGDILAGQLPREGIWGDESGTIPVPEYLLRGFMPPLLELHRQSAWVQWWEGYRNVSMGLRQNRA